MEAMTIGLLQQCDSVIFGLQIEGLIFGIEGWELYIRIEGREKEKIVTIRRARLPLCHDGCFMGRGMNFMTRTEGEEYKYFHIYREVFFSQSCLFKYSCRMFQEIIISKSIPKISMCIFSCISLLSRACLVTRINLPPFPQSLGKSERS